jgi:hypothetical protein
LAAVLVLDSQMAACKHGHRGRNVHEIEIEMGDVVSEAGRVEGGGRECRRRSQNERAGARKRKKRHGLLHREFSLVGSLFEGRYRAVDGVVQTRRIATITLAVIDRCEALGENRLGFVRREARLAQGLLRISYAQAVAGLLRSRRVPWGWRAW